MPGTHIGPLVLQAQAQVAPGLEAAPHLRFGVTEAELMLRISLPVYELPLLQAV